MIMRSSRPVLWLRIASFVLIASFVFPSGAIPAPVARAADTLLPSDPASQLRVAQADAGRSLSPSPALPVPAIVPAVVPQSLPAHAPIGAAQHPDLGHLPLVFTPNQGQADSTVLYQARGMGGSLAVTADDVVLSLPESSTDAAPAATDPLLTPTPVVPTPQTSAISRAACACALMARLAMRLCALVPRCRALCIC